ncbi:hypothetical protein VR43_34205, partial [Streptomyces sp. NRRL S-104]
MSVLMARRASAMALPWPSWSMETLTLTLLSAAAAASGSAAAGEEAAGEAGVERAVGAGAGCPAAWAGRAAAPVRVSAVRAIVASVVVRRMTVKSCSSGTGTGQGRGR